MKKRIEEPEAKPENDGEDVDPERRALLMGALAAVPAGALLGGCGAPDADAVPRAERELALSSAPGGRFIVGAHERARRRRLCAVHVGEENEHDIDGIMYTFARHTEVSINGFFVTDRDQIRQGHVDGGFSHVPGALAGLRVVPDIEYVTDDEIVFEGRLIGTHVAPLNGFPPTHREVSINYVAFYRFDRDGKLVSERLTFNYGVLAPTPGATPV